MYKSVTINIPHDENLPEGFLTITAEKVLLAINVGYKCVLDAEQSMLELTESMIYNKVKEETAGEIKKLETNLLVEKEIARKIDNWPLKTQAGNYIEFFIERMIQYDSRTGAV